MSDQVILPTVVGVPVDIPIGNPAAYYVRVMLLRDGKYSVTVGNTTWGETYTAEQILSLIDQLEKQFSDAPPPELRWRAGGLGTSGKFIAKT